MNKGIIFVVIILCFLTSCQNTEVIDTKPPVETEVLDTVEKELPLEPKTLNTEPISAENDPLTEEAMAIEANTSKETDSQIESEVSSPDQNISEITPSELHSSESSETLNWYSNRNKENEPPTSSQADIIKKYSAYYLGDVNKKDIYLTFDIDYEIGYTAKILDVLKEKNAPSAFFVTKKYIVDNEELVKRMVSEGHIVANHSNTSIFLPDLTNEQLVSEVLDNSNYFKQVTGKEMPKFFRVHSVEYSERILDIVGKLGYETVFWSFAYKDWEVDNQPSKTDAYNTLIENLHNGSIMLLHSVSKTNSEVLPDFIDSAREMGYNFASLDNI